ncbi:MAG: sigma-70 family RNA polymerase sigma factor [Sedimentisphaerales bacterium]|nr:sigma-70 family RNA polymerase sigma factor [Sedimentisphaerales bacterium]
MKMDDDTRIGGSQRRFPSTHWTAIQQAGPGDDADSNRVIGDLLQDYWKPVYCYLRHKGRSNEEAKDLTQGFFQEVVLGRDLIRRADPARGRFRTLLLSALSNYLANVHRRRTALKRIPKHKLIELDQADAGELPEVVQAISSDETFHYAWVSELLDRTLEEVEADCRANGMTTHWDLFHDRVLRPTLEDRTPPTLAELCVRHGIAEAVKASNMIFAVKRRLQAALKRNIRQSVAVDAEIGEEIRELRQFLTSNRQSLP